MIFKTLQNWLFILHLKKLSDRKDAKDIKVVTMIKGKFQSKIIVAKKILQQSNDNTLMVPLVFKKIPQIGSIQENDMFFA